ncbi:MAG: hypothetical protein H6994_02640 [Pseudomonadales bacterium]|nr:hypothetical protein [Pseudomonadales bacterium]
MAEGAVATAGVEAVDLMADDLANPDAGSADVQPFVPVSENAAHTNAGAAENISTAENPSMNDSQADRDAEGAMAEATFAQGVSSQRDDAPSLPQAVAGQSEAIDGPVPVSAESAASSDVPGGAQAAAAGDGETMEPSDVTDDAARSAEGAAPVVAAASILAEQTGPDTGTPARAAEVGSSAPGQATGKAETIRLVRAALGAGRRTSNIDVVIASWQKRQHARPAEAGKPSDPETTIAVPLVDQGKGMGIGIGVLGSLPSKDAGEPDPKALLARLRRQAAVAPNGPAGRAMPKRGTEKLSQPPADAVGVPLAAARRPAGETKRRRDRVMFVWYGQHYLSPLEGRHPLRAARSLYEFMLEDLGDQGIVRKEQSTG